MCEHPAKFSTHRVRNYRVAPPPSIGPPIKYVQGNFSNKIPLDTSTDSPDLHFLNTMTPPFSIAYTNEK